MRADDRSHTSVEVPSEGNFLGSSFGMKVDEDNFGFDLLQKLVDEPERIVAGAHEYASLEIDNRVTGAILLSLVHSPSRHTSRKICRTQQSPRGTVRIAVRHLEVFDDFALVPDMVSSRHDVDAKIEKFVRKRWCDAESGSGILAVGDNQIDRVLLYQPWQAVLDDGPPRAAKNVTDEENVQEAGLRSQVSGTAKAVPRAGRTLDVTTRNRERFRAATGLLAIGYCIS